ncbi:hypothetical protein EU520_01720 [Candidatus Thorarchaeota archaeon]|nr:MAG: hypothetical protein EU520_01720 [Candidatus Thorarchaeota archaeon]
MPEEDIKRGGDTVYRVLSQDFYATDFHSEELGIKQQEEWRSKSRQFTSDSEIVGKVEVAQRSGPSEPMPDLEKNGFMVMRKSPWYEAENDLSRRLVMKFFTDSGTWYATVEEMLADEYARSFSSEMPLLTLAVLTDENEILTYIRQNRRGALDTESYSFFLVGNDGQFQVFRIEGKRATMGDDFRVVMGTGDVTVAEIDSRVANIGGESRVEVRDVILADNDWFCRILQAFSASIKHRQDIWKKIAKGLKAMEKKKATPLQHRFEVSLLANPRRLTLDRDEFDEV